MAPCSSCFTVLSKTNRVLNEIPEMHKDVNEALAEGGLSYSGKTTVRYPLDVLMNDVGIDAILKKQKQNLNGLKIAPYYGCQIVRPDKTFDDHEIRSSWTGSSENAEGKWCTSPEGALLRRHADDDVRGDRAEAQ